MSLDSSQSCFSSGPTIRRGTQSTVREAQYLAPEDGGTAGSGVTGPLRLGNVELKNTVNNFAGKLTWRVNDRHQIRKFLLR